MKGLIHLIAISAALTLTVGCRSFTSPARSHSLEDKKAYWIDYDATRRGALVIPSDKKLRTISEPSPDVAFETITKLAAKLDYKDIKGELSADVTESLVQLGERTQMIMFLRETMFRLSEVGNNADWTKDEYKTLYSSIVDAAVKLADSQVQSIGNDKIKAEARKSAAKAEETKALTEKIQKFEDIKKTDPQLFQKLIPLDK